jgi:1-acyl-sn-glycerol-3-phosphate acyltransferase
MLRGIWVRCVLLVMTAVVGTVITLVTLLAPRWSNFLIYAGRFWAWSLLKAAGVRVTYHGRERAHEHEPCIFIANHQSAVDIVAMLGLVPPSTRFVAKQELFRVPVFGWALAASGCVAIDRGNRAEAIRSLGVAAGKIRDGRSVVLFPEGSRSRDGSLAPFKKGAFHLAVQAGVPVVPVAIVGSFDIFPPGSLRVFPGPVEVFVEPPVDATQFQPQDHNGLSAAVRKVIERRFHDARPPGQGCVRAPETS